MFRGLTFSLEGGVPNLQKVHINKIKNPISATKILWPCTYWCTLHLNRLILYWNQTILHKINTPCGHLVTPYILVNKILTPPLFKIQIFMTPSPVSLLPSFHRKWQSPFINCIKSFELSLCSDWLYTLHYISNHQKHLCIANFYTKICLNIIYVKALLGWQ